MDSASWLLESFILIPREMQECFSSMVCEHLLKGVLLMPLGISRKKHDFIKNKEFQSIFLPFYKTGLLDKKTRELE